MLTSRSSVARNTFALYRPSVTFLDLTISTKTISSSLRSSPPFLFPSSRRLSSRMPNSRIHGDLNNTEVMRQTNHLEPDPTYAGKSLAIAEQDDDADIRKKYRPFVTSDEVARSDWISQSELSTALKMSEKDMKDTNGDRIKILVLYGSMRERLVLDDVNHVASMLMRMIRSYSRLLAFECSRILSRLGADVRVYDPTGLPVKDNVQHQHPKVQELRDLSKWSDGHVWVSPEQHGNLVCVLPSVMHAMKHKADNCHRLPFSRIRLTGFHLALSLYDRLRAAH